ncbi:hypothetical protein [Tenacibaculum xiamenense]|uniref:hypothetical protein n=1 Tax=Tenacibaculum xiamenense TaxID=1261553 RepID=UPI003894078F
MRTLYQTNVNVYLQCNCPNGQSARVSDTSTYAKRCEIFDTNNIHCIFIFNFNIPVSKETIAGKYVNKYYNAIGAHHETAGKPDTLTLKPDGNLNSKFYGYGTYSISYKGGFPQKIVLKPENPEEIMTFHTYISNKLYEKTKISLGG